MQTLLLAENLRQAEFVQNGLHCENLSTNVHSLGISDQELEKALYQADGIFILIQNIDLLTKTIQLCQKIRSNLPTIVLAQSFDELLSELYYQKKISSFFIRPFPFRLISSEIRFYIFREREKFPQNKLVVRDLELNRETHEVLFQKGRVNLRNKEFALLEFLMLNPGRILSRGTILESVWDRNANIFTNTVDVHINKLRKKIDKKAQEKFIRTIHATGYIFE